MVLRMMKHLDAALYCCPEAQVSLCAEFLVGFLQYLPTKLPLGVPVCVCTLAC